jgi:hypothetical protein
MDRWTGNGRVLNSQIEYLHQPNHDQVDGDNQIEQSRNRQNQNACNECNNATEPKIDGNLLSKEEVVKHSGFL